MERAHNIYSFSHLTLQEYFTARFVVDNAASGTLTRLIKSHLIDDHWQEVFLLTASLLDDANAFFETFLKAITDSASKAPKLVRLLQWAYDQASNTKWPEATSVRVAFIIIGYEASNRQSRSRVQDLARELAEYLDYDPAIARTRQQALARDPALVRARAEEFEVYLPFDHRKYIFGFNEAETKCFEQYLLANLLLLDCLQLATVPNRRGIEARLLLPPDTDK